MNKDTKPEAPTCVPAGETKWCAACGKWGDHTSGTCPTIEHAAPSANEARGAEEREVYEVVDASNEETYWPLGVFIDVNQAMAVLNDEELPVDEEGQDCVVIEVRARKVGFHPHQSRVIASRQWVDKYTETTDEYKWVAEPIKHLAPLPPASPSVAAVAMRERLAPEVSPENATGTPRTDAATFKMLSALQSGTQDVVLAEVAKLLESELIDATILWTDAQRDLAEAKERYHRLTLGKDAAVILDHWHKEHRGYMGDPSLGHLQAGIQVAIEDLSQQLAASQKNSIDNAIAWTDACDQLDAVTKERDEATTQLDAWHALFGTNQLSHAIAERDALRAAHAATAALHAQGATLLLEAEGVLETQERKAWDIRQKVLGAGMGDPWDGEELETGYVRPVPAGFEDEVAKFDAMHSQQIKDINECLEVISEHAMMLRALLAKIKQHRSATKGEV